MAWTCRINNDIFGEHKKMTAKNEALKKEPTMEEILSSIKNIISDDVKQATGLKTGSKAKAMTSQDKQAPANAGEVLDLTEMVKEDGSVVSIKGEGKTMTDEAKKEEPAKTAETPPKAQEAAPATPTETPEQASTAPAEAQAPATPPAEEAPTEEMAPLEDLLASEESDASSQAVSASTIDEGLISQAALSESMSALDGLDSISDAALQDVGQAFDGSKTLDVLMVGILKPMLKEWIDANLPSLVKVIVNEQVEKVMQARSGRMPSHSQPPVAANEQDDPQAVAETTTPEQPPAPEQPVPEAAEG